jgi:hypothetical protein
MKVAAAVPQNFISDNLKAEIMPLKAAVPKQVT